MSDFKEGRSEGINLQILYKKAGFHCGLDVVGEQHKNKSQSYREGLEAGWNEGQTVWRECFLSHIKAARNKGMPIAFSEVKKKLQSNYAEEFWPLVEVGWRSTPLMILRDVEMTPFEKECFESCKRGALAIRGIVEKRGDNENDPYKYPKLVKYIKQGTKKDGLHWICRIWHEVNGEWVPLQYEDDFYMNTPTESFYCNEEENTVELVSYQNGTYASGWVYKWDGAKLIDGSMRWIS
jgi:hypothetical protein